MSQDSFNAGISWLSNLLLSTWMAPFCCPITPFLRRLKTRLPLRVKRVNVVLTTGRPYAGVHSYLKELHMEQPGDYCITYNGALVQKAGDGSTVAQTALSYDDYRYRKNCPVRWVLTSTH